MWVTSAEVGKVAEGPFPTSGPGRLPRLPRPALPNSLQQLSLGCQAPSDCLLAAPPRAGGAAGLALYVQTPDHPHRGHYVTMESDGGKNEIDYSVSYKVCVILCHV